ncbi:hypothetical protein TNCV_4970651 [Trichonephila clavipes]|nr:hypothetical protein TNCV_4970651 [Trichonephila clavipes]
MLLFRWASTSPTLTPLVIYFCGDKVLTPPLSVRLAELNQVAIDGLDSDIKTRIWAEMDYRLHVTEDSHNGLDI